MGYGREETLDASVDFSSSTEELQDGSHKSSSAVRTWHGRTELRISELKGCKWNDFLFSEKSV